MQDQTILFLPFISELPCFPRELFFGGKKNARGNFKHRSKGKCLSE